MTTEQLCLTPSQTIVPYLRTGLLRFPDEAATNASDPVLGILAPSERQALVARRESGCLRYDVRLQGLGQTPSFAW